MSAEHASSHAHDGPPLPPEPKTPMWLPALGATLFLVVGLWVGTRPEPPPAPDAASAAHAADAGAPAPTAQAAPPPGAGHPALPGQDAGMQLNPDQAAQLQKILQGLGH